MKTLSRLFQVIVLLLLTVVSADAQTNTAASVAPGKSAPTIYVRAYRFEGETFLPPEILSGVLSDYTGTVDTSRIREGISKLREVYNQAGYTNITISLPPQRLTNGIVTLKIVEIGSKE